MALRIKLTATTAEDLDKKVKAKIEEGYKVLNKGVIRRYYSDMYFAVVEID